MTAGFASEQQRRIAQEAADWRMRMLEPGSEAEVEDFEAWLAANPAHAKAYAESDRFAVVGESLPRSMLSTGSSMGASQRLRPAIAFAGAVAFVVVGTLWFAGRGPPPASATLANPGPAARGVTFRDGSEAILDAGAKLTPTPEREARSLTLDAGRVRLDAPADGDPVTVTTPHAVITGQGSIFDVALDRGETTVWAITGAVVVATASADQMEVQPVTLRSGQSVFVGDGRLRGRASDPGSARWPAGRLSFKDMPLADVVAVANRRGRPKIILHANVAALRVTGVLDVRNTPSLARKLAAALDVKTVTREDGILLTR